MGFLGYFGAELILGYFIGGMLGYATLVSGWHSDAVVHAVASEKKGSGIELAVCLGHFFLENFSTGFLWIVWLIPLSPLGLTGDLPRVYPAARPMSDGIGSSPLPLCKGK